MVDSSRPASAPANRRSGNALLLVGALALGGLGVYINLRPEPSEGASGAPRNAEAPLAGGPRRPKTGIPNLVVTPERIDLGPISHCGGAREFSISMRNTGDTPIAISGWRTTCACLAPEAPGGFTVAPGEDRVLEVRIDPLGFGGKSQSIDFRVDGVVGGPRVRVDYEVVSPIRPVPGVVMRAEGKPNLVIAIERYDAEHQFLAKPFEILGCVPMVAKATPTGNDGQWALDIDCAAIDELAALDINSTDPAFQWTEGPNGRRWKTLDLVVRTDDAECGEVHVLVKNR
jgi:hypothetical protein